VRYFRYVSIDTEGVTHVKKKSKRSYWRLTQLFDSTKYPSKLTYKLHKLASSLKMAKNLGRNMTEQ